MTESSWMKNLLFFALIFGGIGLLSYYLMATDRVEPPVSFQPSAERQREILQVAKQVDSTFEATWSENGIDPVAPADDLVVARRLSLGLAGTIPSLEEIRHLERQPSEDRVHWWVSHLLEDKRTSDHLAERFSRALVGVDAGPFLLFRRRRFTSWLSDQFDANVPYDRLVRQILTDEGLWTDTPSVNFFTKTVADDNQGRPDPILLAGRTSRAFLGMRIDCLQCHDDFLGTVNLGSPDDLRGGTQLDFHSLAAFFNDVEASLLGIRDGQHREYVYKLLDADQEATIDPQVPFLPEILDSEQSILRVQLADWVTHPDNGPFARATVNRVWAIMFGLPLVQPVDDIPLEGPFPPALEILSKDFVEHGYDIKRLIRIIAQTRVFQLDSAGSDITPNHARHWAVFPLIRLRPDQVAGAVIQSTRLSTIDSTSHIITRLMQFGQQNDFVNRFGDPGENEFEDRGETVTQRLLMLNGDMIDEILNNGLNSPLHIAGLSPTSDQTLDVIYLTTLTRRPTGDERSRFASEIESLTRGERAQKVVDLYWALINSAEFRWNH